MKGELKQQLNGIKKTYNASKKRTIVYIGGFELPDKNAAAHRVINNAKILRVLGYKVIFIGISHSEENPVKNEIQGFECWSLPYPKGKIAWVKYLTNISVLKELIKKNKDIVGIIFYNYQSICLYKALKLCKLNHLWSISDVTEWYLADKHNPFFYIIKQMDTSIRMRILNKKADGIVGISTFLYDYYKKCRKIVKIPPLVDLEEEKWSSEIKCKEDEKIHFIYAGSTSDLKDNIKIILKSIYPFRQYISMDIVGIEKEELEKLFIDGDKNIYQNNHVNIRGRISHAECIERIKMSDFQIFVRPDNLVTKAGFPTKFVESLACGTPVITNLNSNVKDYLIDGENGFLINSLTRDGISEVLQKVVGMSRKDISRMKTFCKKQTTFDYHSFVNEFRELLKDIDI